MKLRYTLAQAYAEGCAAGELFRGGNFVADKRWHDYKGWATTQYPAIGGMNLERELLAFNKMRLSRELDLRRFPECRGVADLVREQRRGFGEVCADPLAEAYHYNVHWYNSRVLNVNFVGQAPAPAQCTDFWFAATREGGPIHGSNRDDIKEHYTSFPVPERGGPERRFEQVTQMGGVSASVLCDEAPDEWFPFNFNWFDLGDYVTLPEYVKMLERYADFWGPGNRIYVDKEYNSVALEKSNKRLGVRYGEDGCCAITACAYLTPNMAAFKRERDLVSLKARGWSEDCPDMAYWAGCERRYRRLLQLVAAENKRGATLLGAARIALDHAVPFPDRICLAGERSHPQEAMQNWTLQTSVACLAGPNRRSLYWVIDPTKDVPIYRYKPHYLPGEGIAMRPEWERDLSAAGDLGGVQCKI